MRLHRRPLFITTVVLIALSAVAGVARAQTFKVGDTVECDGGRGPIVGTQPRPGWPEPFYLVDIRDGNSTYQFKCLPARMKIVAARSAPASAKPAPASVPARPPAPAATPQTNRQSAGSTAAGTMRDGTYKCHKMSPDAPMMHVGTLRVRNGKGTFDGMPTGWTIRAIRNQGTTARGEPLIVIEYTSTAGWNDKLDCVP